MIVPFLSPPLRSRANESVRTESDSELGVRDFGGESMETAGDCVNSVGNKCPKSCFLRRVRRMTSEKFWEDGRNHKLIARAVHAVFLESGFVEFGEFLYIDDRRPSMTLTMSSRYTLPEILRDKDCTLNAKESVVLKYQIIGRFVNVFGSLTSGGPVVYRLCLDENKFAPAIGSLHGKLGDDFGEEVLYELWKAVKDGLLWPLLIDLCAKAGLAAPPCLTSLPSELQLKILELLPAVDIGKVGCVCKELQRLSCNNELWKKKFYEEFGTPMLRSEAMIRSKDVFYAYSKLRATRMKRKAAAEEAMAMRRRRLLHHLEIPGFSGMARYPIYPLVMPWLFGGQLFVFL